MHSKKNCVHFGVIIATEGINSMNPFAIGKIEVGDDRSHKYFLKRLLYRSLDMQTFDLVVNMNN